ncbi:MAG: 5-oxoprolinase [Pseudomonadales bacterium]|jgi:N-methylhydantoinase B|uniref:hydantoinase B/oxoprolinase family protein n=1 Tax=unclassified Ketobacter TaxID=2639109 RepID=UPI000C953286|nr:MULTISPECIES: hydantoinase B/oxoprolinase family protein [unclassified Ketobacter]MAQ26406.1 5-oxoprolinase [Pseudomonadales bacterium]MEC8813061.1 hydantoinase B/oxoprolinase family protein [Pseudomonadota bacterium]TNC88520.1 MAG: 5-oxoprolinase [Alcanivorax sp.]HAG96866.1 5-oxoprolinase [Gammaproteobacteria bacterium]RLT89781.1 MAG: hydantoinase B/oxoprolinase family protein [Ketobacter sp. GenoA1]|tara:strand:+ start:269 stop:1903 length:1635 start_codon:yes stop_codon:yes gene_type:complete
MNAIELSLFSSRIESICDEMGAALKRSAFSPNIKDRLDFSCAIFDARGQLTAQAAHIPVHLGSMAYAMEYIIAEVEWQAGDMVVVNDPFKGGTHLPDVTVIAPLFVEGRLLAFVANRAHHANIGATAPGSMPVSRTLQEEGIVIPPTHLLRAGVWCNAVLEQLAGLAPGTLQSTEAACAEAQGGEPPLGAHTLAAMGDFTAQVSANRTGLSRLQELVTRYGQARYQKMVAALNEYAARVAADSLRQIPDGCYEFADQLDDDGAGTRDIAIRARIEVMDGQVAVDFSGTSQQVPGNVNCPLSVAAAAVFYVFRCLMPARIPACAGAFRGVTLRAEAGSLLNARYPAAVAAGNVETSTRVVDVVIGALAQAIPRRLAAASHGSMNNVAMGAIKADGSRWDYYETMGGGMGAYASGAGLSAVQTHMTNTLNTPVESLELHYPLQVNRYQIRRGSGGAGQHRGGDGLLRELCFKQPATVSLLTERRTSQPWGWAGGSAGQRGENRLNGVPLAAKTTFEVVPGDVLAIATPGGGGWGPPTEESPKQGIR